MSDFFELARLLNLLSEQTGNRLSRLRKTKLLDFAFEASFALPRRGHAENLAFEFMANTSLSGGAQPAMRRLAESIGLITLLASLLSTRIMLLYRICLPNIRRIFGGRSSL